MERKRKEIPPRKKLMVLKRDNFTCKVCGRSPVLNPGLQLEADHRQPHSKEGGDEVENLQIFCFSCNQGKGNNEALNKTIQNEIENDVCMPRYLKIEVIPNTINGYKAMYNMGIYTIKDNHGQKVNFFAAKLEASSLPPH